MPETLWTFFSTLLTDPKALAAALGLLFLGYALLNEKRSPVPKLFELRKLVIEYWEVFPQKLDLAWMLMVVTVLAQMENVLTAKDTREPFNQIGIILSLLVSALIGLMPMALSKGDSLEQQSKHDASYPQKKEYIKDIMRIGMFNILLSLIDLILIFGMAGFETQSGWASFGTFVVYWLFGLFSANILILMHKLYLLYFGEPRK